MESRGFIGLSSSGTTGVGVINLPAELAEGDHGRATTGCGRKKRKEVTYYDL